MTANLTEIFQQLSQCQGRTISSVSHLGTQVVVYFTDGSKLCLRKPYVGASLDMCFVGQ